MHQGQCVTFTNKDPYFENLRWVLLARDRGEDGSHGKYSLESINFYPDGWIVCTDGWRLHATFADEILITGMYDLIRNTKEEIIIVKSPRDHYIKSWCGAFPAPKQPMPEMKIESYDPRVQMYLVMQFLGSHNTCVNYKLIESVFDKKNSNEKWDVTLTDHLAVCFWNEQQNRFAGVMSMRYN